MAFHRLAVTALVIGSFSVSQAFTPVGLAGTRSVQNELRMVATTPSDLGMDVDKSDSSGSMMDLSGIVFSVSYFLQSLYQCFDFVFPLIFSHLFLSFRKCRD